MYPDLSLILAKLVSTTRLTGGYVRYHPEEPPFGARLLLGSACISNIWRWWKVLSNIFQTYFKHISNILRLFLRNGEHLNSWWAVSFYCNTIGSLRGIAIKPCQGLYAISSNIACLDDDWNQNNMLPSEQYNGCIIQRLQIKKFVANSDLNGALCILQYSYIVKQE